MTDLLYAAFLGFVAGFLPVYIGLAPLWYFRGLSEKWRALLVSFSIGILLFLFADVTVEGMELAGPGHASNPILFITGLVLGLLGPVLVSRRAGRKVDTAGASGLDVVGRPSGARGTKLFVAYTISAGIGIHNLGEGLAIGASYAAGTFGLTTLLVIGFFLHNSTEGLGISAPMASVRTGWQEPLLLGFFAGFPTILGSMVGSVASSEPLQALFFSAAAGALLYVVVELLKLMRSFDRPRLYAGLVVGVLTTYVTSLLVR